MTNQKRYESFLRWEAMIARQQARKAGKSVDEIYNLQNRSEWFDSNFKLIKQESFIMMQYFIEIPNTPIREPVSGCCYDILYDMAQQYGHAELVWYANNGTRMIQGVYTDKD